MKPIISYPVKVFATGFIVLVLLSLPLFWIRSSCETFLLEIMPRGTRYVSISPTGLVPPELKNDPNIFSQSWVYAGSRTRELLSLGITDYFKTRRQGGRRSNVYFFASNNNCMYFDKELIQIVYHYIENQKGPDGTTSLKDVALYIGPEGVSETADKTLGRFIDPIIDRGWTNMTQRESRELILYDKELRRFFKIDSNKGTVTKGPELKKGDPPEPIQIGKLTKNPLLLNLNWQPPQIKVPGEDKNGITSSRASFASPATSMARIKSIIPSSGGRYAGPYLLVLDKSGRIYQLDKETLKFVQISGFAAALGRLPGPETYFGSRGIARPRDLLGYQVWPLVLTTHFFENPEEVRVAFGDPSYFSERSPSRVDRKYLGMFAASLSRDGTAMALAVIDEKGGEIKKDYTKLTKQEGQRTPSIRSSKAVFFETPWSPTLTIGKFLAENLHPPILSVASYFTASAFEAASGHRALFFLPNSFIAMKGRDYRRNFAERFMSALWWISPSIILAILLAWRVGKNAAVIGLSEKARLYWIIGTLGFGLTAYITYRLTRPKITLVTCQNCGKMRRPDMAKCHRCGSKWHVPELTPPAWRVLDGGE